MTEFEIETDMEGVKLQIKKAIDPNRQYWLPTACTDVNSNAAYMWCHKAYDRFHEDWEKLLQKLLEEGI